MYVDRVGSSFNTRRLQCIIKYKIQNIPLFKITALMHAWIKRYLTCMLKQFHLHLCMHACTYMYIYTYATLPPISHKT